MKQRPYHVSDWQQVVDLLSAYRGCGYVNRYPTIWRLRMLMTSRLWEPERDARLWEDAVGRVIGFAALTRRQKQSRGVGLERVLDPGADQAELSTDQLEWAEDRAREFAAEVAESVVLSVMPLEMRGADDVRLLKNASFTAAAYSVYMACRLSQPVQEADLPAGFTIAPLLESEIKAYERLYSFTPGTREHRLEMLRNQDYQHFVAKAPDGQMAAFIECSINREEWTQNQRHIGWVDYIGTSEAFQRRGLAKALLSAGFGWLKDAGADEARLVTGSDNTAAQNLYTSMGMSVADKEPGYIKNIPNPSAHLPS